MSTIAAGTTSGTALVSTGNTDGTLQLQVNGTTPSVTLATTGAVGVGSTPGYGTSGQALLSNGSAAAPSWGGAGSWVYISTVTASASATVDFTSGLTSTYDVYMIQFVRVFPSADNSTLYLRTSSDGGATFASANSSYQWGYSFTSNAGTASADGSSSASKGQYIVLARNLGNSSNLGVNGTLYIYAPSVATSYVQFMFQTAAGLTSTFGSGPTSGSGYRTAAAAVNAVRFLMDSGNITSGTFRLYGLKNS